MNIRQANHDDYKEIMTLYNDFVDQDRYSNYDNDSFKEVLHSDRNFIYVSEDKGKLVGFATFSVRDVIRYPRPIAELDELYVAPDYRKKGVGKKLLQTIEVKAKEQNCYRLYIESNYKHEVAHKFYEKLEYTNYGYHFYKDL